MTRVGDSSLLAPVAVLDSIVMSTRPGGLLLAMSPDRDADCRDPLSADCRDPQGPLRFEFLKLNCLHYTAVVAPLFSPFLSTSVSFYLGHMQKLN